ncbi:response regulator transcription factor [Plantactinospora sp. GCM10030261]|uniref:response regulator transcription factor n=1 Tax=Plantactinospora sp. GCM10030261 TaxID=3273420 RepID=UPI00361C8594
MRLRFGRVPRDTSSSRSPTATWWRRAGPPCGGAVPLPGRRHRPDPDLPGAPGSGPGHQADHGSRGGDPEVGGRGVSSRQIGEMLYISVETVERHRANLLQKLGLRGRLELTRYAIRAGLIEP